MNVDGLIGVRATSWIVDVLFRFVDLFVLKK